MKINVNVPTGADSTNDPILRLMADLFGAEVESERKGA